MLENKLGITDSTELARMEERISKQKALEMLHFTELSGHHSVLERPLSEVNGRLFFS